MGIVDKSVIIAEMVENPIGANPKWSIGSNGTYVDGYWFTEDIIVAV